MVRFSKGGCSIIANRVTGKDACATFSTNTPSLMVILFSVKFLLIDHPHDTVIHVFLIGDKTVECGQIHQSVQSDCA